MPGKRIGEWLIRAMQAMNTPKAFQVLFGAELRPSATEQLFSQRDLQGSLRSYR